MSLMPPKNKISSDIFGTPPKYVYPLLKFIPKEWKVWESADDNKGRIYKLLNEEGYKVHGTDILNGFDFLSPLTPVPQFDCIITNPPYSIKDEWIARCYELEKPFALLLPLTALEGKTRQSMYKKYGIQLLMPPERINFVTPSGEGSGSWFYSAWFCHGLNLPEQINFMEVA
jgi:hypothetical protein